MSNKDEINRQPLITIIVATYNELLNIQKTLDSIYYQKYNNFEIIVIDGNSDDGTVKILKKNQNLISKWLSEDDHGIYDAWNKGLNMSSGDWIMFLGAGDTLNDDALNNYANFIKANNYDTNFISSKGKIIDFKGNFVRVIGKILNKKTFLKYMSICHPGSLHHKSLFLENGFYDINYKICADYEFLVRSLSSLNTSFIDKILVEILDGGVSAYSFKGLYETKIIKLSRRGKILVELEWIIAVIKLFLKIKLLNRKLT